MVDMKYNRKSMTLARLYQEGAIQINFKESKINFLSNLCYPSIIRETFEIVIHENSICEDVA